jgi:Relaxase/Mobilisation nuclease domain
MIIKSKSRHRGTWRQLLNYMEQGTDERSILITHNVRGNTIEEWVEEFREAEAGRVNERNGSVVLYHELVSFHDEDSQAITRETLDDLALQYINLRAEKGLVVAMSHHDRDHVHVHFCISGVEHSTGKSMRMSQSHFTAVKRSMQTYQQKRYPELVNSIADHGRKARAVRSDQEYLMKQRTGRPSKREELSAKLRSLFDQSRSIERFSGKLKEQGMELYHRNGRPQGVLADGIKYRLSSLGISKEEVERAEQASSRLHEMECIRERAKERELDRDESSRERLSTAHPQASEETTQQ